MADDARPTMKIINQETRLAPVSDLRPHPRNVNRGDDAAILESIQTNGFFGSVIAQRSTGHILAGTHRWKAARAAGATEIPVTYVDVDDAAALKIMLADNRTARLGADDPEALAELLQDILAESGTLVGTGYTSDALDGILSELGIDARKQRNDDPQPKTEKADALRAKWGTGGGQVWEIPSRRLPGKVHRIACGDSTKATVVEALMAGDVADLVWTDPPYGVDYKGGPRRDGVESRHGILNDNLGHIGTRHLVRDACIAWPLKPGGAFYVCSPAGDLETEFRIALIEARHRLRQQLVWVKDQFVLGRQDYHWRHETILYGWRDGAAHYFVADFTQDTIWAEGELKPEKMSKDELVRIVKELYRTVQESVWREDRPERSDLHPTTKPRPLIAKAIKNSSRPGEIVFDGFSGSGSCGIVCEQTGRIYRGVELDPKFVAVLLEQYADMGLQPKLAAHAEATSATHATP